MTKKIAFLTDPLETLNAEQETTLALIREAARRGHQLFFLEGSDIHLQHDRPVGYMAPLQLQEDPEDPLFLGESFLAPLERLDLILLRKNPPFDLDLLFALDALQMVDPTTLVLNPPRALRSINEHLFPLQFPLWTPQSLVTKNPKGVNAFLHEVGGKVVLRSLESPPGRGLFFLRMADPNLKAIADNLTGNGQRYVLVQKLVTEQFSDGDKRLFLLDGEILGAALQVPSVGEMRGSFEMGAEVAPAEINDKDRSLVDAIGPELRENGFLFATVDVIDGLITDINLTCPNGLPQIQSVCDDDLLARLFDFLEERLEEL